MYPLERLRISQLYSAGEQWTGYHLNAVMNRETGLIERLECSDGCSISLATGDNPSYYACMNPNTLAHGRVRRSHVAQQLVNIKAMAERTATYVDQIETVVCPTEVLKAALLREV